jgi:nucleoside-diphosphate-sugar epimerase
MEHLAPQTHDIQVRVPDTSKAARLLDWQPKVDLDEGLRRTIAWIRDDVAAAAPR